MTTQLHTLHGKAMVFTSYLDTVLDRAGITSIPNDLVEAYKQQELDWAPKSDFVGWLLDKLGIKAALPAHVLAWGSLILCICGGVAFLVGVFRFFHGDVFSTWSLCALTLGVAAAVAGGYGFWFFTFASASRYRLVGVGPARWVVVPAEDMLGSIPQFVYARMMCILGIELGVRFEVADLRQNKYSLDPILYAVLGEERRPITIWKNDEEVFLS